MNTLEHAIANWRREMANGGIKSGGVLDELESHLRDEISRQIQSGTQPQCAFDAAVKQIGPARLLQSEFEKVNHTKLMKRVIIVSLGFIGVLVGAAFITPAVALYRNTGAMSHENLAFLSLGVVIALAGVCAAVLGFKRRSA